MDKICLETSRTIPCSIHTHPEQSKVSGWRKGRTTQILNSHYHETRVEKRKKIDVFINSGRAGGQQGSACPCKRGLKNDQCSVIKDLTSIMTAVDICNSHSSSLSSTLNFTELEVLAP